MDGVGSDFGWFVTSSALFWTVCSVSSALLNCSLAFFSSALHVVALRRGKIRNLLRLLDSLHGLLQLRFHGAALGCRKIRILLRELGPLFCHF